MVVQEWHDHHDWIEPRLLTFLGQFVDMTEHVQCQTSENKLLKYQNFSSPKKRMGQMYDQLVRFLPRTSKEIKDGPAVALNVLRSYGHCNPFSGTFREHVTTIGTSSSLDIIKGWKYSTKIRIHTAGTPMAETRLVAVYKDYALVQTNATFDTSQPYRYRGVVHSTMNKPLTARTRAVCNLFNLHTL